MRISKHLHLQNISISILMQPRVVNGPHIEARTRPEPDIYFEARFRPESQIYRVSQDMHNCGVSKNEMCGYSCRYTVWSHSK